MESGFSLEDRVLLLEDKVNFIMNTMRMAVKTGLIDKKIQNFSLLDMYLAARAAQVAKQTEKD